MQAPMLIVLDTYPLSSTSHLTVRKSAASDATAACNAWVRRCVRAGHRIVVPAIAYYEALREFERRAAVARIERMAAFTFSAPDRYLPITDDDLFQAAKFWAQARNAGTPNASVEALDGDSILAAQVRRLAHTDDQIVVATTNVKHLAQFVPAMHWTDLDP